MKKAHCETPIAVLELLFLIGFTIIPSYLVLKIQKQIVCAQMHNCYVSGNLISILTVSLLFAVFFLYPIDIFLKKTKKKINHLILILTFSYILFMLLSFNLYGKITKQEIKVRNFNFSHLVDEYDIVPTQIRKIGFFWTRRHISRNLRTYCYKNWYIELFDGKRIFITNFDEEFRNRLNRQFKIPIENENYNSLINCPEN